MALPFFDEKNETICNYLDSGMDFRCQRVVSYPSIYFKSCVFYSVGGKSRNKPNTFIRWEMMCCDCCIFAATTRKQSSFPDELFNG